MRKASFNRGLLRAALDVAPEDMRIRIMDVGDVPLYNRDVEDAGPPASVLRIREAIRSSDGLLVATPEHNYSFSAVTKAVIEWASRPPGESVLEGKPVGVIGAAPSGFGTVRAQVHFRDMAPEAGFFVMQDPEVRVSRAREKFDAAGNLIDDKTREELREFLAAFAAWIERFRSKN